MSHITTNNRMLLTYMFSNYFRPPNIAIYMWICRAFRQ